MAVGQGRTDARGSRSLDSNMKTTNDGSPPQSSGTLQPPPQPRWRSKHEGGRALRWNGTSTRSRRAPVNGRVYGWAPRVDQERRAALVVPGSTPILDPANTPLSQAVLKGDLESAKALLAGGADVNGRNPDGGTALHVAALMGRAESVQWLIDQGADVNARDQTGQSPRRPARCGFCR